MQLWNKLKYVKFKQKQRQGKGLVEFLCYYLGQVSIARVSSNQFLRYFAAFFVLNTCELLIHSTGLACGTCRSLRGNVNVFFVELLIVRRGHRVTDVSNWGPSIAKRFLQVYRSPITWNFT